MENSGKPLVIFFRLYDFLFIIAFHRIYYSVPYGGYLYVSSAWSSLSFLDLRAYSFHQIWNFVNHYFLQVFFLAHSPSFQGLQLPISKTIWYCYSDHWCSLYIFSHIFSIVSIAMTSTSLVFSSVVYNLQSAIIPSSIFHFTYHIPHAQKFNLGLFHISISLCMFVSSAFLNTWDRFIMDVWTLIMSLLLFPTSHHFWFCLNWLGFLVIFLLFFSMPLVIL